MTNKRLDTWARLIELRKAPELTSRLEGTLRIGSHLFLLSLIFSTPVAQGLAMLLFLLWLFLWPRWRAMTSLDVPVLIFFAVRMLSVATSVDPAISAQALRKIPFLLIYFPISHLASTPGLGEMRKLLRTLVVAGIAVSLYGLTMVLCSTVYRLQSTTSGPTTLAMFLATTFAIGGGLAAKACLLPAYAWLAGLTSMLAAMAYTYCRAPWFSALMVGFALTRHWRRGIMLLAAMAVSIGFLLPGLRMRYEEVLLWPHELGDRPIIWKTGVHLAQQRPLLGYGPETFHLVFDKRHELRDQGVGAWHNFVLQIGVESGIIGVISFFWILAKALQILRRARRRREEELAPAVATALLAGLTCMLLAGLFGGVIGDPVIDLLLWSLLGLVAGLSRKAQFTAK